MNIHEIISFIQNSASFAEVRNMQVLPEPDQDDGFYFVSYSHKDYKAVLPEIVKYADSGLHIWYDRFLESGKSWTAEVHKKIASYYCKGIIFYVTENFLSSDSCLQEVDCALKNGKSCVFVLKDTEFDGFYEKILDACGRKVVLQSRKIEAINFGFAIEDKKAIITALEKPELFEYYFYEGGRVFKIFKTGRIALVKKVNCNDMRKVELPRFVTRNKRKYRVGGIMQNAFSNNSMLEEVTVPDGWAMLTAGAFTRCKSLHTVNLGTPKIAGFLRVGSLVNVFVDCPNLSVINKFKGIIIISGAFINSQGIKSFNSKGYVLTGKCFSGCVNLENVTLSPNTRVIEKKIFENCKALKTIAIPAKVRKIDVSAFKGCENLKEVVINAKSKRLYRQTEFCQETYKHREVAINLDDIFCFAEKIYLKKVPKFKIFKGGFKQAVSDKKGYTLFVREQK